MKDLPTMPIPLLGPEVARSFSDTQAEVHFSDGCSACGGHCPTPEACQLPVARATKPPRAAFWLLRLINSVRRAVLRWELECVRDERLRYEGLGWASSVFIRNCLQQEMELMARIRELETSL